jgi:hypothetical protein
VNRKSIDKVEEQRNNLGFLRRLKPNLAHEDRTQEMGFGFFSQIFKNQDTRRTYCLEDLLFLHKSMIDQKLPVAEYKTQYATLFERCQQDITPVAEVKQEKEKQ